AGALLAIDLDGDEPRVERLGERRILEGLALHDVAPVASGVADGEKDRLVLAARGGERVLAPGTPVHRVVRVLEKIRTLLVDEPVGLSAFVQGVSLLGSTRDRTERGQNGGEPHQPDQGRVADVADFVPGPERADDEGAVMRGQ